MRDDTSGRGLLVFAGLLVPVWWNWVLYTFYADRFDTHDVPFRLLMLGGMLAMCAVTITVPDALGPPPGAGQAHRVDPGDRLRAGAAGLGRLLQRPW